MEKKLWAIQGDKNKTRIVHDTWKNIHDRTNFAWTSCSAGFDTKEELFKHEGILDEPCRECGCHVTTNYVEDTKQALIRDNLCFYCNFWKSKLAIKDDPTTARIGGTHYMICPDQPGNVGFKGFGGAEFNIRFNDGRFLTTHNLWCQGEIPEVFKDRLPDNAVFVTIQHTERDKVLNKLFPELS